MREREREPRRVAVVYRDGWTGSPLDFDTRHLEHGAEVCAVVDLGPEPGPLPAPPVDLAAAVMRGDQLPDGWAILWKDREEETRPDA